MISESGGVKPPEVSHDPQRLRRWRYLSGLRQDEAASRAGCSATHLCNLEKGRSAPGPELLGRLAATYGCTIADLMAPEAQAALRELGPAGLAPGQRDYR